jgi:hypothetical protein
MNEVIAQTGFAIYVKFLPAVLKFILLFFMFAFQVSSQTIRPQL